MKIDDLVETLIATGEKFQIVKTKGSDVIKIACGYRYPKYIAYLVNSIADEKDIKVELQSHTDGIPVYAIEKMVSINGYTKFSW